MAAELTAWSQSQPVAPAPMSSWWVLSQKIRPGHDPDQAVPAHHRQAFDAFGFHDLHDLLERRMGKVDAIQIRATLVQAPKNFGAK